MKMLARSFMIALMVCTPLVITAPASAQLFGVGKFKVQQSDDRFSTDGSTTYSGLNNRVSKRSVAGGTHIDGKGMFVEPVAIARKADKAIIALSLFIHNETDFDTAYGAPNSIGVPQRITFLADSGPPIVLIVSNSDRKWSDVPTYNTFSRSASSRISETGFADLTAEQFHRIASASVLVVRIEGSVRSVVYEAKDISKSFIPNLLAFYSTYVMVTP